MTDAVLERAVEVVASGGVAAVPTDTLVGLLALATDEESVARVLAIKGPGRRKPIPVLVPDLDAVASLAAAFPEEAKERAAREWPGALTLVLPARAGLPAGLTARGSTIGVRMPGPSPALDLVRVLGRPLTGTSANLAGQPAATSTDDLDSAVAAAVDLVWPGTCPLGRPSTVVDYSTGAPTIIR